MSSDLDGRIVALPLFLAPATMRRFAPDQQRSDGIQPGSSLSSAQREMARAEQAGVGSSRRLGSTRLVTAADSPLTGPLAELLLRSFGPRQVVAVELAGMAGVGSAFLFGS